jgi:ribosomal protein S18 acetylase RimI-like enzyme
MRENEFGAELIQPTHFDISKLDDTLTQAFMNDPVLSYDMRQDNRRRWALRRYFNFVLESAFEEGEVYATKNYEACAVWYPPGKGLLDASPEAYKDFLPEMLKWSRKDRLDRLFQVIRVFAGNRPSWPHYYLEYLGVAPKYQGRGLGTLLLRSKLSLIDTDGTPAYLENSNEKNTPLYSLHGFKVIKRTGLAESGPVLTFMSRDSKKITQ